MKIKGFITINPKGVNPGWMTQKVNHPLRPIGLTKIFRLRSKSFLGHPMHLGDQA